MRILVCGGRNYTDQDRVFQELSARHDIETIELVIEGGAKGADSYARYWAWAKGIPCMTIHAAWAKFGRAAGPIRNRWMLKYGQPDLCLAFPGGTGTDGMKKLALAAGCQVRSAE